MCALFVCLPIIHRLLATYYRITLHRLKCKLCRSKEGAKAQEGDKTNIRSFDGREGERWRRLAPLYGQLVIDLASSWAHSSPPVSLLSAHWQAAEIMKWLNTIGPCIISNRNWGMRNENGAVGDEIGRTIVFICTSARGVSGWQSEGLTQIEKWDSEIELRIFGRLFKWN